MWRFIVTTTWHEIWLGYARDVTLDDQKALKASVKRSGYLATS